MQITPEHTAHNATNTLPTVAYAFDGNEIRTVFFNDDPWFIAKDVAEALGYTDTDQAIRKHCKAAITSPVESTGQMRHMRIIPERDVYRLIFNSRRQSAARFEDWVVTEVLPSIRKRGMYIMGQQKIRTELLDALAENIREKALPALREFDRLTEHDHWLACKNPEKYKRLCQLAIDGVALDYDLPRSVMEAIALTGLRAITEQHLEVA